MEQAIADAAIGRAKDARCRRGRLRLTALRPMLATATMLALVLGPVLAPVGAAQAQPATQPFVQPIVQAEASGVIRLGVGLQDDVYLAPVHAAERLGLFEEANLAIRRSALRGAEVSIQALRAGQVDVISVSGADFALAAGNEPPGRIVFANASGFHGWKIIVNQGSDLRTVQDLAHRRVGVSTVRSLAGMAASLAARSAQTGFDIQPVGAGALIPMLRDNTLEAVAGSPLLGLREVVNGQARILHDIDTGAFLVSAMVASKAMIDQRPDDLRKFLAATGAAIAYMQANADWSVALLQEYAHLSDPALARRIHDVVIARLQPGGEVAPAALQGAIVLAAEAWNLPELAETSIDELFTNAFLAPPQGPAP